MKDDEWMNVYGIWASEGVVYLKKDETKNSGEKPSKGIKYSDRSCHKEPQGFFFIL